MNAVIVDLKGKYAAALDESGAIIKIPDANYTIGQTVQLHELQLRRRIPSMKRIAAAALAASLILSVGMGTAYALPYGTVSLEADAAIEYTINRFDRVLGVKALNEEGEAILAEIDPDSLRFRPVEQAISVTLEAPELSSADATPARITAITKDEHHSERLQEHLIESFPGGNPFPDGMPEQPQFQADDSLSHGEDGMHSPNNDWGELQEQNPELRTELPGGESHTNPDNMTTPDANREGPQEPASGMPGLAMEPPGQNTGMHEPSQGENGTAFMPQPGPFTMPEMGGQQPPEMPNMR